MRRLAAALVLSLAATAAVTIPRAAPAAAATCHEAQRQDTAGEVGAFDITVAGVFFDCATKIWDFGLRFGAPLTGADLLVTGMQLDADGDDTTGCGGKELLAGVASDSQGQLFGALWQAQPACVAPEYPFLQTLTFTVDGDELHIAVPNDKLGNPTTLKWNALSLSKTGNDRDLVPDTGGVFVETNFASGGSSVANPQDGVDVVVRLAGDDRFATSVAASKAVFPDGGATAAVVATGVSFADALAGTPLAKARNGPLLLTSPESLPPAVGAELTRVLAAGAKVLVLGGPAAVSETVVEAIRGRGFTVERIAGADRFETAVRVAEATDSSPAEIFVADGSKFPDALVAGAAAAKAGGVVVLTAGTALPAPSAAYIQARPTVHRTAVGGAAAAADPSADPIVGPERFATASKVAERFFPAPALVGVASGENFPDALSGGVHAALVGAPLLLSLDDGLPTSTGAYCSDRRTGITKGFVYGGEVALNDDVLRSIQRDIDTGAPSSTS